MVLYMLSLQIVHKKTASVLCLTSVKNEDKLDFSKILEAIKVSPKYILTNLKFLMLFDTFARCDSFLTFDLQANFNDKFDEQRKKWGGGVMGSKSQAKTKAKERLLAKEAAQRMS